MPSFTEADARHLSRALDLARGQLGKTWPNPSVGAVVVRNDVVLGEGATATGGRPHAEPSALGQAGDDARGATIYVTLEPCSHWGKSPPCADAIVQAGIARAVIATTDPDPRVAGRGIERLSAAGIECELGLMQAEADELNRGFFHRLATGRPWCTLVDAERLAVERAHFDAVLHADKNAPGPETWSLPDAGSGIPLSLGCDPAHAPDIVLATLGRSGLSRVAISKSDPLASPFVDVGMALPPSGVPTFLRRGPLVLATHNAGKAAEFRVLFGQEVELSDAGKLSLPAPDETAPTFVGNAVLKARAAAKATGRRALADDGGIVIPALGGEPGLHTARFADANGGWTSARRVLAERVGLIDDPNRRVDASIHCALALTEPGGETVDVHVEVHGSLRWPPRPEGPGYAPIFDPLGGRPIERGGVLLHRRLAFGRLMDALSRLSRSS